MRHKRTLKITVTRREFLYGSSEPLCASSWCSQCDGESSLLTPVRAAGLLSVSTREIYRMLESGRVHYLEESYEQLLICLNSLLLAESNIDRNSGVN